MSVSEWIITSPSCNGKGIYSVDFLFLIFGWGIFLCSGWNTVENVTFAPNLSNVSKPQEGETTVLQEEF